MRITKTGTNGVTIVLEKADMFKLAYGGTIQEADSEANIGILIRAEHHNERATPIQLRNWGTELLINDMEKVAEWVLRQNRTLSYDAILLGAFDQGVAGDVVQQMVNQKILTRDRNTYSVSVEGLKQFKEQAHVGSR
jgi:hypothetical protein